jgi:two-component system chemotaxis response regulator CheB
VNTPIPAKPAASAADKGIRVMIVDDSAVIRSLLGRALAVAPEIKVVGTASNGQVAIDTARRADPDVIVLDIEMPVMDGITALPKLLAVAPRAKVLMASTLTLKNAEVSLRALSAGASDYIPKPEASQLGAATDFNRELVAKVRTLAGIRKVMGARAPAPTVAAQGIALRPRSLVPPRVIAIGSSTGGPQALLTVLGALPDSMKLPILVTQHMPPTFTTILAEHLTRAAKRPAKEATNGMAVEAGNIYVAPGGFHMIVEAGDPAPKLRLTSEPPENFVRPAVDPMLRTTAAVYGSAVLCVILTGMGSDGAKGSQSIADAGGTVIAQDEQSSVVWGMPGATAAAGTCSAVLPLTEVAPFIMRCVGGRS